MQKLLAKFTEDYIMKSENSQLGKDERRIINNPIVYLFIGDESLPALKSIYKINEKRWTNHDGIIYLHVHLKDTWAAENVFSFKASESAEKGKRSRPSLYDSFYADEQKLVNYNQLLRQINIRFAELGKKFHSFLKVNISVITQVNDPLTVIFPELTMLLEHSLKDVFTMTYLDAFCLLEERAVDEGTSVLGLSFLRELKHMQQQSFSFSKEIHVTKDKIQMPVTRNGPLFDLVYILSDKNEQGMFAENNITKNFEIISTINMMKNKRVNENEYFSNNEMYNNVHFSKNIQNEDRIPAFVTAGFSKVSRPNEAISNHVLYSFFKHLSIAIRDRATNLEQQKVFEMLELDSTSIERKVISFFPTEELIVEMLALMPSGYKYSQLKTVTLKEAEDLLFGHSAEAFFQENLVKPSLAKMKKDHSKQRLQELLKKRIGDNPKYGVYSANQWIEEFILQSLQKLRKEYTHHSEVLEEELDSIYGEYGSQQGFRKTPFFENRTTGNFISHLLVKIYQHKLKMVIMKSKIELINEYMMILEKCQEDYKVYIQALESMEQDLQRRATKLTSGYQNKINQNIPEYYERMVESILHDIKEKHTADFYFEDKNLGSYSSLLKQGTFAERVLEMCQRHIFESGSLDQSFEQEILARSNVKVAYGDPQVMTKEELFSELYQLLEKDCACNLHLLEFAQKHRYEEKYYIGDFQSSFIQYALGIDQGNRSYRLGCIHENSMSGIEKLSLMGGFAIEDLRFYQNNVRYYEKYQENGYEFHPKEISKSS